MEKNRLSIKTGRTLEPKEKKAVREFHQAVHQDGAEAVIFFCSSRYDLDALGSELASSFDCPLIGCTTAGEISTLGYQQGGIVGASLRSDELKIHRRVLSPLSGFSLSEAGKLASALRPDLSLAARPGGKLFGLILIDGLSYLEEETISSLYTSFEGLPIVGGSAGDDSSFTKTFVYDGGRFISNAAVFTVFETTLPFATFMIQHFQPTDAKVVITGADPARRIITEINGEPAALEYARVLGLEPGTLTPAAYSRSPFLLKIGGEWYVRSCQKVNPDNSLSMFSAIEEGLVLTIGQGVDMVRNFRDQMAAIEKLIPKNRFFIFCDCILRRLEMGEARLTGEIDGLLSGVSAVGFSTYGEQFNSIHVNQTLTGVVIGE